MAACVLTTEPCVLEDVPDIEDIRIQAELLRALGATVEYDRAAHRMVIAAPRLTSHRLVFNLASRVRMSFLLTGPLLARLGEAEAPHPGGCAIGARPVNVDVRGFEAMGAIVRFGEDGRYRMQARRLHGRKLYLDYPSVTGTENLLLAACLAEGTTVIKHAACEPEVVALAEHLNRMGACIRGAGTPQIEVIGMRALHGARTRMIPDRIEAGTFAVAAAISGGEVVLRNVNTEHLDSVIYKLNECGVETEDLGTALRVRGCGPLVATEIQAIHYPGFPTDLQPPFGALLTQAHGWSIIHERVFENRLGYVAELVKLGAQIEVEAQTARIWGRTPLHGAQVQALDLRCGLALVLAGLVASSPTEIADFSHVERGHEALASRLRALGARLEPLGEPEAAVA